MRNLLLAVGLTLVAFAAQAVPVTSSTAVYVSTRDCIPGVTACDSISPTNASVADGLPGASSAAASMSDPSYGSAAGTATLTGVGEAVLTGNVSANAGKRNSSNAHALSKYTNASASVQTLTFSGTVAFDQIVPPENAQFDPLDPGTATKANFSLIAFTLTDAALDVGVTALDNFLSLFDGFQYAPGFSIVDEISGFSVPNTTFTGGGTYSIDAAVAAGQSVWLYALLQTPASNGGTIDASLTTSVSVPAPAGIGLLALGLIGLLRARRSAS